MSHNAATYLRSSKDRSDVSISAQRRELAALAKARGLRIAREFEDAVESGSSDRRPGFVDLLAALKDPQRGWDTLLIYDTSRLARRRYIAQAFKHQARRRGVAIVYARMPADVDPIAEVILESSFEAMDEVLSLMSRDKGLMGMRENVARGFRAGGRAPMGYRLKHTATGAMRDGKPVMKSTLVRGADAERMRRYLKARASGQPRNVTMKSLGLTCNPSSLIGVEWNALTYAGHTVWNVHKEPGHGTKRRSREEWVVHRDTHEALITDADAESILARLMTSPVGAAVSRAKAAASSYLLTGLLVTPDGAAWTGKGGRYYKLRRSANGPGKLVPCEVVDRAVLTKVTEDIRSDEFLAGLIAAARSTGLAADPGKPLRERLIQLDKEKSRAAAFALTVDDGGTFSRLVEERSSQIAALRAELAEMEAESALHKQAKAMTPTKLRALLLELGGPRKALPSLVDRVVLDKDLGCRLYYRTAVGLSMASPRGFDGWAPTFEVTVKVA
jgi:DNA invertase Pin-like site-specific DNA recombinase